MARLLVGFRDSFGKDWPSDNAFLAGVEKLIVERDTVYLLASPDDDSPPGGVAQVRFRHSVWTASPDCWLEDLFVEEGARRRGVARALLLAVIACGEERGARRVELDCNERNTAAIALYEAHGFSASAKGSGRDLYFGRKL